MNQAILLWRILLRVDPTTAGLFQKSSLIGKVSTSFVRELGPLMVIYDSPTPYILGLTTSLPASKYQGQGIPEQPW
jgi:hypothetical protein